MADVRSLLRSELASRKAGVEEGKASSKKRKNVSEDAPDRKRVRNIQQDTSISSSKQQKRTSSPINAKAGDGDEKTFIASDTKNASARRHSEQPATTETRAVDEDEWARFEQEMAGIDNESRIDDPLAALNAQAAAESAPLSAEELARQAREELSAQKSAKDIEAEEEREDEARRVDEEFEEMTALEERVKKLRERREALRDDKTIAEEQANVPAVPPDKLDEESSSEGSGKRQLHRNDNDDSDDDDEDDDEWLGWGRR